MDIKIEVKQEDDDVAAFPSDVAVKTEIKSETPFTEYCSQGEREFLAEDLHKKYNSDDGMHNKIEVEEESYCFETETSSVCEDVKDGPVTLLQDGGFSPRMCTEAVAGGSSGKSSLPCAANLVKDIIFCDVKDCSQYQSQEIKSVGEHCHSGKYSDKNTYNSILNLNQNNYIDKDERRRRCNICEKSFTRLSSLKLHNLIHEGKKPHRCNICEKSFAHLSYLKLHNLIHELKKPHKCNICDKSFTRLPSLKLHSLIHEGKRAHKCNICEKSFTQLSHLKRHNLIHEGKKTFKCETCDKSFTESSTLRRHNLIHEGKKPHKCEICDKRFTQLSALKRHNLIHKRHKAV